MGKKKKDGGKKKAPAVVDENYVTLDKLKGHYKTSCKLLGVPTNATILAQFGEKEDGSAYSQLLANSPLGPAGTRAVMLAFLGASDGMNGEPYREMKSLRFWKAECGDDGARAISLLLKEAPADKLAVTFVEMLDCDIGSRGCLYWGEALGRGGNTTLTALELNYNPDIGDEGAKNLCKGLRHNTTLLKLHMEYCGIKEAGAKAIASLLATPTALQDVSICGNEIGNEGLIAISDAMKKNTTVTILNLADNSLSGFPPDASLQAALESFGSMLSSTKVLETVKFDRNHIEKEGAEILIPHVKNNKQLKAMTVDIDLPEELFKLLNVTGGGGKKKGKKGKKKGKKK